MKKILLLPFLILFMSISNAQVAKLQPGAVIKKELRKGEKHVYQIDLVQGEYFECVVNQEGVDVVIEVIDASHQIQGTFDSPNEKSGPEPVSVNGTLTGNYRLVIYPLPIDENWPDSLKAVWADENQGKYQIVDIIKLSAEDYQQKMALVAAEEQKFTDWIYQNAHQIKSVVATSESDDLEHFKKILNNVRVVGLGEATHGTSEFFTMKHRMLKFLAEEMNFRSFYIEASMARCRYINDYVLHGSGNLDTATSIQGFVTWRVDEFRNMIEWIRQYNTSVPDDVKIKFMGYDLQVNDRSWSELIDFYHQVDVAQVTKLDSLRMQLDSASALINKEDGWQDGVKLYKKLRSPCHDILVDMSLNRGKYEYRSTKESYQQNLQNVRLIVQELESYLTGYSRDFYMAENILDLLNQEKPGARVVVWAHNFHIGKSMGYMGHFLEKDLREQYYAIGFEFYSGSFQSRNIDSSNHSNNWDIISVGDPPEKSLPWLFNQTGMDQFYVNFRNSEAEKISKFSNPVNMHFFGSMYSTKWPETTPISLKDFDGMIYIKKSTAAHNFTKVYIPRQFYLHKLSTEGNR